MTMRLPTKTENMAAKNLATAAMANHDLAMTETRSLVNGISKNIIVNIAILLGLTPILASMDVNNRVGFARKNINCN